MPVSRAQLADGVLDLTIDRIGAGAALTGDLLRAHVLGDHAQTLALALREEIKPAGCAVDRIHDPKPLTGRLASPRRPVEDQ